MINNIKFLYRKIRSIYFQKKFLLKNTKLGKSITLGRRVNIDKYVRVGDFSYIGQYSYIGPNTNVGNFALFSDNVNVIGFDHVYDIPGNPTILSGRPNIEPETTIGDDVWLGHGVTIIRGVSIGNGVIVAANSVVTRDIPSYEVWAGVPAKKIKERFSADEKNEHEIFLSSYKNGLIKLSHDRKI